MGLAAVWCAGYIALHALLLRALRPRLYFVFTFRVFLAALAALMGAAVLAGLRGFAWWNSVMLFASLWVYYMIFTFHVMRSVSIRTLVELVGSPAQGLTAQELEQFYDSEAMFDRRIDSMVANEYLIERNGTFTLTAKGRVTVRIATLVRRLLNIQHYG